MTRSRRAIAVQNAAPGARLPKAADIRRWAGAALGDASGEIAVRIVAAEESAALNARYRGKPGATNVLSFPAGEQPAPLDAALAPLGDVVVCADVLEREASEQGKALEAHWAHIVVHGVLHLQGYDHGTAAQARVMEARERELLAALGFPDPYG